MTAQTLKTMTHSLDAWLWRRGIGHPVIRPLVRNELLLTALFLLARLGGALFVRLFTTEPELAAEALSAIHICTLALIPLGLQYAIVDGFTGMGKVQLALPLSAFRKAVYFIALFALPAVFGARAAFYAEPISDIAGPVVSIAVYALCIRRILDFPADPPAAENKSTLPS